MAEVAGIMELSVTEMETLEEEQLYIYFLLLLFVCGGQQRDPIVKELG